MSKILVVSNLNLCRGDFFVRLERLCEAGIWGFVLREKELDEARYFELLVKSSQICKSFGVEFFAHSFVASALRSGCANIHFPLSALALNQDNLTKFARIGASVHSVKDALLAQNLGANMMIVGHIFETECKKGLAPRGIKLLKDVKRAVKCDIFAIGGINSVNFKEAISAGADGICVMSGAMECADERRFIRGFLN